MQMNKYLDNKEHLQYFRGKYKGYLYGIKICNKMLKENISLKRYELYNQLKEQKRKAAYNCNIKGGFAKGLEDFFYDPMNYISLNEM